MNIREQLNKFSKKEQQEIVRIIKILDDQKKNSQIEGMELVVLFDYWRKIFPKQKQRIHCLSCRKAVYKFFGLLAKEHSKMIEVG